MNEKCVLVFNMMDGSQFESEVLNMPKEQAIENLSQIATAPSVNVVAIEEDEETGVEMKVNRVVNPFNIKYIDVVERI